jgi:ABC-type transporter Mla subunit MlaD
MAEVTIRVSDRTLRTVGILFAGIVLASVLLYLGSSGAFVPKYDLRIYIPEVSGLSVHAPVRVNGIQVGSVGAIKLAEESATPERKIELVLRVDKRYQTAIRTDSFATISYEGILGSPYITIRRGFHGSVIDAGGEVRFTPARELTFANTVDSIKNMMDCLQSGKDSR